MWGERINEANIMSTVFPRVAGMAELLWTEDSFPKLPVYAVERLSEWVCRMNLRGINAAPLGPGFCDPF